MDNTENKTTLEKLLDFATLTNRKAIFTEQAYPSVPMHPVTLHKRTIYMPDTSQEQCFLVGYSDPKRISENGLFFGAFLHRQYPKTNL